VHPENVVAELVLGNAATDDRFQVREGVAIQLDVLANDWRTAIAGITTVEQPAHGGIVTISADGQSLEYTPPAGFIGSESFSYTVEREDGTSETASVTVNVKGTWQNHKNPRDVNQDGRVDPRDLWLLVNDMHRHGTRTLPKSGAGISSYVDVSGDGRFTPQDILLLVREFSQANARNLSNDRNLIVLFSPTERLQRVVSVIAAEQVTDSNENDDAFWSSFGLTEESL